MKKSIIILLILPYFVFSQEEQSSSKFKKYSIGISYSIDRTYRVLKNTSSNSFYEGVLNSRNKFEEPSFNFSSGLNLGYFFNEKLSLRCNVLYARIGHETGESALSFSDIEDPRRGNYGDGTPAFDRFIENQNYLNIPIGIRYSFLKNKLKLFMSGGFSTNIFLNREIIYVLRYTDGSEETFSQKGFALNKFNFMVYTEIGAIYDFKTKYEIILNFVYRNSLNEIYDANIKEYPYVFGLNLGINYKF